MRIVTYGQLLGLTALVVSAGCGAPGIGAVSGTLLAPECQFSGAYNLNPSYFGANLIGASLTMFIQNGGGTPDFTDNMIVTVDDSNAVQQMIASSSTGQVTLQVGPMGAPGVIVHATLMPNWTCAHPRDTNLGQNVGLWADTNPATGVQSTITFRSVANSNGLITENNDPNFTDASAFSFFMHDPRPIGFIPVDDIPEQPVSADTPVGQAMLTGSFQFHLSQTANGQMFFPSP